MVNRKIDPETTFTGLMVGSISLQGLASMAKFALPGDKQKCWKNMFMK